MSKKYRINLDPVRDILNEGWVGSLAVRCRSRYTRLLQCTDMEMHGLEAKNPDHWPQALLEEIEEELDRRYILEDAPVEVSNDEEDWHKGHWAKVPKLGYQTFCGGQTSHTTDGRIAYWGHWRIPSTMDPDEWKAKWYKPPTDEERLNNMEIKRPINLQEQPPTT